MFFAYVKDTNNLFRSCRGQGFGSTLLKNQRMLQETFWAYEVGKGKSLSGWSLITRPIPKPGPKEVLVKMKAAAFNFRDIYTIEMGLYPLPVKEQLVPLADGAGEVVAIGESVDNVKVGERVSMVMFPDWVDGPFNMDVSPQLGGSQMRSLIMRKGRTGIKMSWPLQTEKGPNMSLKLSEQVPWPGPFNPCIIRGS